MITFLFILSLISFFITSFLTPVMIVVAKKFKLVDDPKKRTHPAHTHSGVIPRGGGLPIFLGIFICYLIFFPLTKPIIGIILGALILIIVGL